MMHLDVAVSDESFHWLAHCVTLGARTRALELTAGDRWLILRWLEARRSSIYK
jgi:hypothetical protein